MISGFGVFAFRDPWGIRPLILGSKKGNGFEEFIISSESVAIDSIGYQVLEMLLLGNVSLSIVQINFIQILIQ